MRDSPILPIIIHGLGGLAVSVDVDTAKLPDDTYTTALALGLSTLLSHPCMSGLPLATRVQALYDNSAVEKLTADLET